VALERKPLFPDLRCQRIELLRSGKRANVVASHLSFATDHVHDLDAAKDDAGTAERLESKHRSSDALDRPVALLNERGGNTTESNPN
jgi:hypothetical protein